MLLKWLVVLLSQNALTLRSPLARGAKEPVPGS
jgi:hypothetical protein